MKRSVEFYSEGHKLAGDLYLPDDLPQDQKQPGVVLCGGYTGVKEYQRPDEARAFNKAGYAALAFDHQGWGKSEGPRTRLAPYSRVLDVQAAMTFLGLQPEVNAQRIGLYGVSYGGAIATWVAAVDQRAKCTVSVKGVGNGTRWMRSVRRPDEWFDLLDRSQADRERRVMTGVSELVESGEVLVRDRKSAELADAARRGTSAGSATLPLEFVDDTVGFNPEWIVDKISPRAILFITSDNDRLVPPEESVQLHALAKEPKMLVVLKGYGHYELHLEPGFGEVMDAALKWFGRHMLPE